MTDDAVLLLARRASRPRRECFVILSIVCAGNVVYTVASRFTLSSWLGVLAASVVGLALVARLRRDLGRTERELRGLLRAAGR